MNQSNIISHRIIELEDALDDAIELNLNVWRARTLHTTRSTRPQQPVSPSDDMLKKWRKLQGERAEARIAAANAKAHKHHMKQAYDEQDRLYGNKAGQRKRPK